MNASVSSRLPLFLAGAVVVAVPLAFDYLAPLPFTTPKLMMIFALTAIGLGALLGQWRYRAEQATQGLRTPLLAALLWLAWLAVTTAFSISPLRSLVGNYAWQQGLITRLGLASLAWLSLLAVDSERSGRLLIRFALAGSVPVVAYGLAQAANLDPLVWTRDWVISTLGNPNPLAGYLAMLLPLTVQAALHAHKRRLRLVLIGLGLAQAAVLPFTDSRGGMAAAGIGVALVLWWHWRRSPTIARWVLGGLLVVSLAATATVAARGDAVGLAFDRDEMRYPAWESALHAALARPLLGWGPATFDLTQPQFATPRLQELTVEKQAYGIMDRAHNLWLELAVETGFAGLLLWIAFLALIVDGALRAAQERPGIGDLLRGGTAALAAGVLYQVVNPGDVGGLAVLWWLTGWLLGVSSLAPAREAAPIPNEALHWATQAFFVVAVVGTAYAVRLWLLLAQ